jgi:hypothetical protein
LQKAELIDQFPSRWGATFHGLLNFVSKPHEVLVKPVKHISLDLAGCAWSRMAAASAASWRSFSNAA